MARSGTYGFNPRLVDHIDEAFERCGIDPAELKARHIRSAIRSANLMFSEWITFGYQQHTLEKFSLALTSVGQTTFTLPAGGFDIFHATLKRDDNESEMYPISRSSYNALHRKTLTGKPDRYFVDRGSFLGADPASTVYIWQAASNITDTIEMWYMRRHQDAGDMSNDQDTTPLYYEAFAAGLSYHLSRKFAPDRQSSLKADYLGENYDEFKNSAPGGALGRALSEDRDTGDLVMRVQFGSRGRR